MKDRHYYGLTRRMLLPMAAMAVIALYGCSRNTTQVASTTDTPHMVGAYTEGRTLTKEEQKLFGDTYKGDVQLTPVTVSTQVVAGTNYKFICKDKDGNRYQVVIYQKLPAYGGGAEVTSVEKMQ